MLAGCRGNTPARADSHAQAPAKMAIAVATAHMQKLIRAAEGQGALFAKEKTTIAAEVSGRIAEINADLGDKITAGQVLVHVDPTEYQLKVDSAAAALAQAEARKANAQADFGRAQQLKQQKMMAPAQYDQISAALKMAQADGEAAAKALALAQKKLGDTAVKAPFDGFVQKRLVSLGQYINQTEPLYELVAIDPIKLRAPVPERFVPLARVGLKIELSVAANPGKTYTGEITRIAPALDDASRTLLIEGEVANTDGMLKPGYFAHIKVSLGEDSGLFIPQNAILRYAGVARVFLIKDGVAHAQEVSTGAVEGDEIEILKGLQVGDAVAVSDTDRLAEGIEVIAQVQS